MVVPDGVVKHEAGIPLAPRVPDARVRLDDHIGHAEQLQPRAQAQPALPAADDEHVRLSRLAAQRRGQRRRAPLVPVPPAGARRGDLTYALARVAEGAAAVGGEGPGVEVGERGEERARLALLVELQQRLAAARRRPEAEPALEAAVGRVLSRRAVRAPAVRLRGWRGRCESLPDVGRALERAYAPRERHHVSPEAALGRKRLVGAPGGQAGAEVGEPAVDSLDRWHMRGG
eukprot:scaffold17685_cov63-Phaeocystis_antarctica.AAC.6